MITGQRRKKSRLTGAVRSDEDDELACPVAVVNGKATLSHTFTELGDRRITAVFSGTDGYLGSETQAAVTVKVTAESDGGDPGPGWATSELRHIRSPAL